MLRSRGAMSGLVRVGSSRDDPCAANKATRLLNFRWTSRVKRACVVALPQEATMDATIAEPAIKACLTQSRKRLDDATRIAKAAEVCAQPGSPDEAVHVALDI